MPVTKINNPHLYALIAGEMSGDTLGAGLMSAILRHDPQARFIGVGGPRMIELGLATAFRMEAIAVMGVADVMRSLLSILRLRRRLTRMLLEARPCVLIGIDSPDFNLSVERCLKRHGIPTLHYVSPSVWAWREGRMKTIRASCDEVLALLPFEKEYYDRADMPCTYVGHTLASRIPFEVSMEGARERLSLYESSIERIRGKVVGVMAGSRLGEMERMVPVYTRACRLLKQDMEDVCFISVAPTHEMAVALKDLWLEHAPDLSFTIYVGSTHDVIAATDVVLLTSGTIALEAMLLKKPMCVCYRVGPLSAMIARRMLKVSMFSLPNLLARREIVTELIQEHCTPENIFHEVKKLLTSDNLLMRKEFLSIHQQIRLNSDELAAQAVFRRVNLALQERQAQLREEDRRLNDMARSALEKAERREAARKSGGGASAAAAAKKL